MNNILNEFKFFILKLRNVNDIDFYVGGLAETPNGDALLGPTFSCKIL